MTFCFSRVTTIILYALIHDIKFVAQEDKKKVSWSKYLVGYGIPKILMPTVLLLQLVAAFINSDDRIRSVRSVLK